MITTNKTFTVTYTIGNGKPQSIEMAITAKQLNDIIARRMASLLPNAAVQDISEKAAS